MRSFCPRVGFMMSRLAFAAFITLTGCGGNSSSSAADEQKPSGDEKSLFLVGVVPLDPSNCIAKADANAALVAEGVWDLAFTSSYTTFLLVGNQLLRAGVSETERVSLRSAEITLTSADGTVLQKYASVGTGFIDATTSSAGYAVMSINVIPATLALNQAVQNEKLLIAKIRVLGEALNGTPMTSSELDFPIRVCTGCLVEYPPEAADPLVPLGSNYFCSSSVSSTSAAAPPPCVLGQDAPFPCSLCAASVDMCRDPSLNPSLRQ